MKTPAPELEKKDGALYLRVAAAQKRRWTLAARHAGMGLSLYVRQAINRKVALDLRGVDVADDS